MPYLGSEGSIQFQRVPPEPVVIPTTALNVSGNYVTVDYDDWLAGEEVYLVHSSGYVQGYVHRDPLDRIYFHSTRDGALSNNNATRLSLSGVSTSKPVILAANINSAQRSTLSSLQSTLSATTFEKTLRAWPTTDNTFKGQATSNPWLLQGQLRNWELERSAPEIDVGALGEKFGTAIKSTVSGSGTLDFIIQLYSRENYTDVDPLLRLVQLTEQGSQAKARFYLKQPSLAVACVNSTVNSTSNATPVYAAVFFAATLLITSSSVRVSSDEFVYGSANFITTGPIRLLTAAA